MRIAQRCFFVCFFAFCTVLNQYSVLNERSKGTFGDFVCVQNIRFKNSGAVYLDFAKGRPINSRTLTSRQLIERKIFCSFYILRKCKFELKQKNIVQCICLRKGWVEWSMIWFSTQWPEDPSVGRREAVVSDSREQCRVPHRCTDFSK